MAKNITLALPDEVHEKMRQFQEIRWSEVARQAIEQRIHDLEEMNRISAKSNISDEDIREFSQKIKRLAAKRFMNVHRH